MDNHMDNNPNGNRPDNNKGPGRQDPNKNHQSILAFLVCLLVTLVCFAMFTNMLKDNSSEITYDKFIEMVDDGDVKEVTLQSNTLTITPKHQSSGFSEEVYYANQMESVDKLTERLEGTGIKFEYKKPDAAGEIISMLVSVLLPTILLFVLLTVFMRRMNKGGGMMGVGKSRAKAYIQKDTGITFRDVAGQDEAKESLQEVVDFLHNPGKYTTIGAKLPKGALLVGPPGTRVVFRRSGNDPEIRLREFPLRGRGQRADVFLDERPRLGGRHLARKEKDKVGDVAEELVIEPAGRLAVETVERRGCLPPVPRRRAGPCG